MIIEKPQAEEIAYDADINSEFIQRTFRAVHIKNMIAEANKRIYGYQLENYNLEWYASRIEVYGAIVDRLTSAYKLALQNMKNETNKELNKL